jgi:hypothetical protein
VDFAHESSGFDCSVDQSLQIMVPSEPLAAGMRLRWSGIEGSYLDQDGNVAAFDPSVFEHGPGALLVRQDALEKYLAENNLEVFWTVMGEKQLVGSWSRNEAGWLEIDGVYRLAPGGILGQCRSEYRVTARPRHHS